MGSAIASQAAKQLSAAFGALGPEKTPQAISGTSARITLTYGKTYRVIADTQCWVRQMRTAGVGDVASAANTYLPADQELILSAVPYGDPPDRAPMIYLNVFGTSGFLYVTELVPGSL